MAGYGGYDSSNYPYDTDRTSRPIISETVVERVYTPSSNGYNQSYLTEVKPVQNYGSTGYGASGGYSDYNYNHSGYDSLRSENYGHDYYRATPSSHDSGLIKSSNMEYLKEAAKPTAMEYLKESVNPFSSKKNETSLTDVVKPLAMEYLKESASNYSGTKRDNGYGYGDGYDAREAANRYRNSTIMSRRYPTTKRTSW